MTDSDQTTPWTVIRFFIQVLLNADWCTEVPGITFFQVSPVHVEPLQGAHTKNTKDTQTFCSVVYSDVVFPRWCLGRALEGVAWQHSRHTLPLWVVTVLTDPSHRKHTVYELRCTHSLSLSYTDRTTCKTRPERESILPNPVVPVVGEEVLKY